MTENTEKTVEELQAELDARRAETTPAEPVQLATRDRSPVKPQDHQPENGKKVSWEFRNERYEADARFLKDVRTSIAFRRGEVEEIIPRMVGEDGYERLMKSIEDEDGFTDAEDLGHWLNEFYKVAGAKN